MYKAECKQNLDHPIDGKALQWCGPEGSFEQRRETSSVIADAESHHNFERFRTEQEPRST
jgi:hypothetical protein